MSDDAEAIQVAEPAQDEKEAAEQATTAEAELRRLRRRLVRAELRTQAALAGMIDLDGVKLIDTATVPLTESGELVDGPGVIRALRTAKPWLFGLSSSSAAAAPRAKPVEPKTAMQMSIEEWKAARAELLRRR